MPARTPGTLRAVLVDLDDTLLPWQTVAHWQWAWRPRGPVLSERHLLAAVHRSLHAWDRRRWQGLVKEAPPIDATAYEAHVAATLLEVAGHGLPPEETAAVVQRFLKPAGEIETYPDAVPFLARLSAEGVAVAVTTDLPSAAARHALHRAGLGDLKVVATGDDPGAVLPAPEAFRAAAAAIGVRPREALYVGDLFWSDVRAAARVGFPTVLVDRHDWSPRVLARRVRSLAEVPDLLATAAAEAEGAGPDGPPDAPGEGPPGPEGAGPAEGLGTGTPREE